MGAQVLQIRPRRVVALTNAARRDCRSRAGEAERSAEFLQVALDEQPCSLEPEWLPSQAGPMVVYIGPPRRAPLLAHRPFT